MTTPFERLVSLKKELEALSTDPWSRIEAWIVKATPIIRSDWPDHLQDFQKQAAPQWTALPIAFGRDKAENHARVAETHAIEAQSNRSIATTAMQNLLQFLDGLIVTESKSNNAQGTRHRWLRDSSIETLVGELRSDLEIHDWKLEAVVEYVLYKAYRTNEATKIGQADLGHLRAKMRCI